MVPPFEVSREDNTIAISGRLNVDAVHYMAAALRDLEARGYEKGILDFRKCESAFPDGIVPVAAIADSWRRRRFKFDLQLPEGERLARLFVNSNLAHFIQPGTYPLQHEPRAKHVPIRRFETLKEQVAGVAEFVEVAMRTTVLPRDVLQGLEWSLNEIMDNVLNHAQAAGGGFVQATTTEDRISFTVADAGIGILASLREGYPSLRLDTEAIGEAIKAGVTRNPEKGQGNGLAGTLNIATQTGGSFTLISGQGALTVFHDPKGEGLNSVRRAYPVEQAVPGTMVGAQILRNPDFRMERALGFTKMTGGVYDLIEARDETATGSTFVLKLADETTGFGSRESGRQVRTKCLTLLSADPTKPLVLDWTGVPIVSSSFADEAIGKLFVALGPLGFTARVRVVKVENLVRQLIDKAIMQRMAQTSQQLSKSQTGPIISSVDEDMGHTEA